MSNSVRRQLGLEAEEVRKKTKNETWPLHDLHLGQDVMMQDPANKWWSPADITRLCKEPRSYIDKASFASDLESICQDLLQIDDLNALAVQYNCRLLSLLDKHAPVTSKTLPVHPKVPWFSSNLTTLKRQRRKAEKHWRTNMLDPSSRSNFQAARNKYRYALSAAKCSFFSDAIIEAEGDQKKLYSIIKSLTTVKSDMPLPHHTSLQQLAEDFGQFFIKKIEDIRTELNIPVIPPNQHSSRFKQTSCTIWNNSG